MAALRAEVASLKEQLKKQKAAAAANAKAKRHDSADYSARHKQSKELDEVSTGSPEDEESELSGRPPRIFPPSPSANAAASSAGSSSSSEKFNLASPSLASLQQSLSTSLATQSAQKSEIDSLSNSLRNLEQALQAQREGQEGSQGFHIPRPTGTSLKDRKHDELIQDLHFQILYGDTQKDAQLARIQQQMLLTNKVQEEMERKIANMMRKEKATKHANIEQWMRQDTFTAVL